MIKLYPVLVANSVSKNIIPGLLKAIERFALIYKLDEIADDARKSLRVSLRKVGKKLVMKEETDQQLVNYLTNEILYEQNPGYDPTARHGQGTKQSQRGTGQGPFSYVSGSGTQTGKKKTPMSQRQKQYQTQQQSVKVGDQNVNVNIPAEVPKPVRSPEEERIAAREKEAGRMAAQAGDATISIGQMDMKSISLEPTWMKVDTLTRGGNRISTVIGVKAVPVAVKSDAQLASLLMFDKQVGRLFHLVLRMGRYVSGILYRIYARTVQRIFDPDPAAISGNPYKDIVLKRTIIDKSNIRDIFLVLNQADLTEDFTVSAKGIRKLMNLGWQSFCVADDVNRRLTFCMKEFKGMCQYIPYTMLYHTLDQARVFEDLEDVRRSSTSLFKGKIPFKKLIGESIAKEKLDEFSVDIFPEPTTQADIELLNEIAYIDENFASMAKRVTHAPKQFVSRVLKGTVKIPRIEMDKLLKVGKRIDPQFVKAHTLAKRVFTNSLKLKNIDPRYIDWAAFAIVIKAKASSTGKDLLEKTKDVLMAVIPTFRKVIRKAQASTLNIPAEHRVEAAIGIVSLFLLTSSVAIFYLVSAIAAFHIKPFAGDAIKAMNQFFTSAGTMVKNLFSKAEADAEGKPEMIKKFWAGLFQQTKTTFNEMYKDSKEFIENKLEGIEEKGDSAAEFLERETGMTLGEMGIFILLSVVGLVTIKWMLKK